MTNREEAILALKELRDWEGLPYCIEEPMKREGVAVITQEVIDMAIKSLEQKWIPVSKKLPEKKDWYIVTKECGEYHFIDYAYFDGETWLERRAEWRKLVYAYDIIAWMSNPQPYYEEKKALEQEDVFDKIKAEVEKLPITDTAVKLVAEILDKHKTESEEVAMDANSNKGVLEKINEEQDSLIATCKAWDKAIEKDGYVD